jgi:hypothetical protein
MVLTPSRSFLVLFVITPVCNGIASFLCTAVSYSYAKIVPCLNKLINNHKKQQDINFSVFGFSFRDVYLTEIFALGGNLLF